MFTEERVENEMTVAPSLFDPLAQQTTTFVNLKKFTAYNITVLCFTDPGDGPISSSSLVVTHEDGKLLNNKIENYIIKLLN